MKSVITLWSKPSCVQCDMVKKKLIELHYGLRNLSPKEKELQWRKLQVEGVVVEFDLTAEENLSQLEYFKGLGYLSAPITEFQGHAIPGFIPAEITTVYEEWNAS